VGCLVRRQRDLNALAEAKRARRTAALARADVRDQAGPVGRQIEVTIIRTTESLERIDTAAIVPPHERIESPVRSARVDERAVSSDCELAHTPDALEANAG
jgi:hypothetical protein